MKEKRYPFSLFLVGFITNVLFRFFWLFIPSVVLLIVGIRVDLCLYAGLALLGVDVVLSLVEQIKIRKIMLSHSDNEQFRKFQEAISKDGNVFENVKSFVEEAAQEHVCDESLEKNNFVVAMCSAVCKKCDYGNGIEKLNEHERVFYVTQILEMEVNNGGFSQFFCNSSGNFSNELVGSFTKIGAFKTAEICKKALAVFNCNVPADRDERNELFDSLDCDDVFEECDDEFYEYEDNLTELNYTYIMEHRAFFE